MGVYQLDASEGYSSELNLNTLVDIIKSSELPSRAVNKTQLGCSHLVKKEITSQGRKLYTHAHRAWELEPRSFE